jgi:hypothetical protein
MGTQARSSDWIITACLKPSIACLHCVGSGTTQCNEHAIVSQRVCNCVQRRDVSAMICCEGEAHKESTCHILGTSVHNLSIWFVEMCPIQQQLVILARTINMLVHYWKKGSAAKQRWLKLNRTRKKHSPCSQCWRRQINSQGRGIEFYSKVKG